MVMAAITPSSITTFANAFVTPLSSSQASHCASNTRHTPTYKTSTSLWVSRERTSRSSDTRGGRSNSNRGRGGGGRGTGRGRGQQEPQRSGGQRVRNNYNDDGVQSDGGFDAYDQYGPNDGFSFDEFEDDYGDDDYHYDDYEDHTSFDYPSNQSNQGSQSNTPSTSVPSTTFYSQKSLTDPSFSIPNTSFFPQLCQSAKITRPSRIQSLAWPPLLRGENCIVADQTGSGKTLAYMLPLLQKLHLSDRKDEMDESLTITQRKKMRTGSPRIVVLTPTAELADQIHSVCTGLNENLSKQGGVDAWNFSPFVTTATGSHATNIRDQIRMLQSTPVDVLISTPGRLATILRTKNAGLDLGHVQSMVLDEVDFLLVDETFGPQLRTVGVAVQSGSADKADAADGDKQPQFIFVTATLPDDVLESIKSEFPSVTELRGPGLHRITPSVHQSLVDVSVPATSNRDPRACFDIKVRELLKALRSRRCRKTLIFCNTVETCRNVENVLRRKDRRGRRNRVWAYHNALGADVRLKNLYSFSHDGANYEDDDGMERILVCTDRAARGIDFDASPIDHVVLFDFPKDPAEYVRRVGRTARAGRAGASTVFAYGWQLPIARQIMGLASGKGKKKGFGKLENFTMMRSSDGWDEKDREDEFYTKGGGKRRKEIAMGEGGMKKKPRHVDRGDGGKSNAGKTGK